MPDSPELTPASGPPQDLVRLVERLPLVVYSVEPEPPYRPTYVSEGVSMLGYSRDEWLQRPDRWLSVVHPDDRDRVIAATARALGAREVLELEYRMQDKHGGVHWVLDRGRFLFDDRGRATALQGVFLDITDRREAERSLRESELRFRNLFEDSAAAHFISRADGTLLHCNAQFLRLFGFRDIEHARRTDMNVLHVSPEHRLKLLHQLERDGKLEHVELPLRRLDGTVVQVIETVRGYFDPTGHARELHGQILDVTEQRRLEQQLHQAQKLEAIGRLAGGIAHDFNNLLNVIGNYTELLLGDADENAPSRQDLEEIRKAVQRGAALTRQLLTFSRRRLPEATLVEVDAVIRDAERMMRRLIGPEVELVLQLDGGDAMVFVDRGQLDQILVNLIVNASDAMPKGGTITVVTTVVQCAPPEDVNAGARPFLRVEVRDTGVGMDAETRVRAVDPFFTTKSEGGTGLGLSTVFGITRQLGGTLSIDSEPGAGTSVVVLLPIADAPPPEPAVQDPEAVAGGAGQRILLVEDEEGVRVSLARILERNGFAVTTAADGADALRAWDSAPQPFDLVITDVRMPGMSGGELIRRLRERDAKVRVVAISGYPEDQLDLPDASAAHLRFIAKPVSPEVLMVVVRDTLLVH